MCAGLVAFISKLYLPLHLGVPPRSLSVIWGSQKSGPIPTELCRMSEKNFLDVRLTSQNVKSVPTKNGFRVRSVWRPETKVLVYQRNNIRIP
jgi:hypothetical protein